MLETEKQQIEIAKHSDPLDAASQREMANTALALQIHANRAQYAPKYDDEGGKTCIDCEEKIAPSRAAIPHTVRCMDCQVDHEKRSKYN